MKEKIQRHGEVRLLSVEAIPPKAKFLKECHNYIVGHLKAAIITFLELQSKALWVSELDNELYLDVGDVGI